MKNQTVINAFLLCQLYNPDDPTDVYLSGYSQQELRNQTALSSVQLKEIINHT